MEKLDVQSQDGFVNMGNSYAQNRRQASVETLFKIAKILDLKVAELLNEELPKVN